jgi:hypothetical protein
MSSQFLYRLFKTAELPPAVLNVALSDYVSRYPEAFSQNRLLGPAATDLTKLLLEKGDDIGVIALIRTRNIHVVSALLSYEGPLSDTVLLSVANIWILSGRAAKKLASHTSDEETMGLLHGNGVVTFSLFKWLVKTRPRRQSFKFSTPPFENKETINGTVLVPLLGYYQDLSLLSSVLREALGDGSSSDSMDAWRNFLGLVGSDPDVPLQTVLDTARRLAFAAR